jgi:hypothetical protein
MEMLSVLGPWHGQQSGQAGGGGSSNSSVTTVQAAKGALRLAFQEFTNCEQVLKPPSSRGVAGMTVTEAINQLTFVDGRQPGRMDMAGGPNLLSFAEYHSMNLSVTATTLLGSGGRPSNTIVLWHDFFGNVAGGYPNPLSNQYATLIHEYIHAVFKLGQPSHSDILRSFRISVREGENVSGAIERWIKNDCKDVGGRIR